MLGAIAYQMTSTRIRRSAERDTAGPAAAWVPNFDRVAPKKLKVFRDKVIALLLNRPVDAVPEADKRLFEPDFNCLAAMNDVLSQDLFDVARQGVAGLNQILWRNRTLQEFFAAHWLAGHGTKRRGQKLWEWIYRPDEPPSEEYYWVWRFLAEMPEDAFDEPRTWLRSSRRTSLALRSLRHTAYAYYFAATILTRTSAAESLPAANLRCICRRRRRSPPSSTGATPPARRLPPVPTGRDRRMHPATQSKAPGRARRGDGLTAVVGQKSLQRSQSRAPGAFLWMSSTCGPSPPAA